MGAETFMQSAKGKTVKEAFASAREEAQYRFGHDGYTGSIAEKNSFIEITIPDDFDPMGHKAPMRRATEYADHLIGEDDPRIDDKWGPAGAIKVEDDKWLFFGWASS